MNYIHKDPAPVRSHSEVLGRHGFGRAAGVGGALSKSVQLFLVAFSKL